MAIWEREYPYFFTNVFVSFFLLFEELSRTICLHFNLDNEHVRYLMIGVMAIIWIFIFIGLSKFFDKHYIFEWQREYGYDFNRYIPHAKSIFVTPLPYLTLQLIIVLVFEEGLAYNHYLVLAASIFVALVLDILIMANLPWFFKHKFLLKEKDFDDGIFIRQPKENKNG